MAIDVVWQDEGGKELARYNGPSIDSSLPAAAGDASPCLRFVDPYGDTTFNAAQVDVLANELQAVAKADGPACDQARSLLVFIECIPDRLHRYLKFIGD